MEFLITLVLVALLIFIFYALIFIIIPLFVGASYEGSNSVTTKKIVEFSKIKKGEKIVDLGSGDGRILIEFAKRGAEAHGFEINPFLVLYSKMKIRNLGLKNKAFVHWKSFWKANLGEFDVVVLFQVGYIMKELKEKLKRELKKGSRIVSNNWKFPHWKCKKICKGDTNVYLYEV